MTIKEIWTTLQQGKCSKLRSLALQFLSTFFSLTVNSGLDHALTNQWSALLRERITRAERKLWHRMHKLQQITMHLQALHCRLQICSLFLSFCMDKELMEGTFGNLLRQKPSGNWQKSNPPPTVEYYSRNPHQNSHHDHEQHGVLKYLDLCLVIRAPLFLLPDLLLRLCIVALPLCLG